MVVTDDDALADRLRVLRNHGRRRNGWRATFVEPGFNYRMSDLNAALGPGPGAGLRRTPRAPARARRGARRRARDSTASRRRRRRTGSLHPYQAYVVVLEDRRWTATR